MSRLNQQLKNQAEQVSLAEHHSPSRYATLKIFLDTSLKPDIDPVELATAAELDPIILLGLIRLHKGPIDSIERWYEGIDVSMISAFAMTMASDFLRHEHDIDETVSTVDYWNRSLLHSLLAQSLSGQTDKTCAEQARLAGLLALTGKMLPIVSPDTHSVDVLSSLTTPDQDATAQHSAELLRQCGCKPSFCDAIRYQHTPLENLADASLLIRATAVAGVLIDYVEIPESIPDAIIEQMAQLGFDSNNVPELIRLTASRLEKVLPIAADTATASASLRQAVDTAGILACYHKALSDAVPDSVEIAARDAGKFLFSFNNTYRLVPNGTYLEVTVTDDETIRIPANSDASLLAASYQDGRVRTILPENATCIQDSQLLHRIEHECMLCIPVNEKDGMLVCGIERNAVELSGQNPQLLDWYKNVMMTQLGEGSEHPGPVSVRDIDAEIKLRIDKLIHEVNNPYSTIQNYLHNLSFNLGKDSPLQKDIESISKEITRSAEILRSFTGFNGSEKPEVAEININETIKEVISVFKGSHRNIRFTVDLDDSIAAIKLNNDDLKKVLVNIIKNAVECFEDFKQHGNKSKIMLSTNSSVNVNGTQCTEIVISDNGPGLPEEIQSWLFEPRLTTKGPDHAGLGLGIVRELIDAMDGMITCKTKNGNGSVSGTTFSIYL